jgi:hypothetical protein
LSETEISDLVFAATSMQKSNIILDIQVKRRILGIKMILSRTKTKKKIQPMVGRDNKAIAPEAKTAEHVRKRIKRIRGRTHQRRPIKHNTIRTTRGQNSRIGRHKRVAQYRETLERLATGSGSIGIQIK